MQFPQKWNLNVPMDCAYLPKKPNQPPWRTSRTPKDPLSSPFPNGAEEPSLPFSTRSNQTGELLKLLHEVPRFYPANDPDKEMAGGWPFARVMTIDLPKPKPP